MILSLSNLEQLRHQVENEKGFQIAIAPMLPATFLNVKMAADNLYNELRDSGFSVLLDDRSQKPNNMFEVIEFLDIRHRVVISNRSISAGVYEYKDLNTNEFVKVPQKDILIFLQARLI